MGHDRRDEHQARHPVLLTLRAAEGLRSLRSIPVFTAVRSSIAQVHEPGFRVLHFSVQQDHVHAIVEANHRRALTSGIRSLAIRIALAVKRVTGAGKVWADRYHARSLTTPREVRNAIVYVLLNFRKHLRAPAGVDPRSSGPWFDGWKEHPPPPSTLCPTSAARTWLATIGWRRRGLIDVREQPGPARRR
jgi:REP element-mobilizing transposase RayT